MFEALVLVLILVLMFHLDRRVKRLEERLAMAADAAADCDVHEAEQPEADAPPSEIQQAALIPEPAMPLAAPRTPARIISSAPSPGGADAAPEPATDESAIFDPAADEPTSDFGFEELFGRRLPIWAGGITLAIAGMLIVKLSIEAGLLSPPVRVIVGTLFGFLLIGAAELALRQEQRVRDPRVRQALAGAGIASLYGSILVAASLYQLIGPLLAMVGLAGVTGLALILALRFGAPCALLGLVGGLAAPALIGSAEPNIPLLSLYLALAVGGLCTLSRGQRWTWLGISALVGGFGWGLLLIVGGALNAPDAISIALYLLLLGVALPMMGFAGDLENKVKLAAAIVAAAQMAALVATGGFALLNWGLFGLISMAMLWLATREPALERLPPVGLVIALLLLGAWPVPPIGEFTLVIIGVGLIYGVPALRRLWRADGGLIDAGQLVAVLLLGLWLPLYHFYGADNPVSLARTDTHYGLLASTLAALSAGMAAIGWKVEGRKDDARFALLTINSALLAAFAAAFFLPPWLDGTGIVAAGLSLLILGRVADDRRLEPASWMFAGAGLIGGILANSLRMNLPWQDLLSWGAMAAVFAAFAWLARIRQLRATAQFLAPILLYGALQAIIPLRWQPLIAPTMLVGFGMVRLRLAPAMASTLLTVIAWAITPIGRWLAGAMATLVPDPMLVSDVPDVEAALLKLALPATLIGLSLWFARNRLDRRERIVGMGAGAVLAAIAAHSLYKQLFAIASIDPFIHYGLAERTLWEMLLVGGAFVLWRLREHQVCSVLLGAALGHFTLYTALVHNPLWSAQAVGSLPLLNLLPLAYAVPALVLLALPHVRPIGALVPARARPVAWMATILLFAASMLRQLFHGGLLAAPGLGQAEDIARSIVAIALAIGFLLWGIRTRQRAWRVGSLVLMLGAVAKVFLWDTQGLEGLFRIASFIALGFSLIGIGWLYSRQLAPSKA